MSKRNVAKLVKMISEKPWGEWMNEDRTFSERHPAKHYVGLFMNYYNLLGLELFPRPYRALYWIV